MTTHTTDAQPRTTRSMTSRWRSIMALQLANPMTLIWWPVIILGFIFLLNFAIVGVLNSATDGAINVTVNGGIAFIYVYILVMAIQSVNQTFPLALGLGSTRRDYMVGTGLLFVMIAIGFAALIATLAEVEQATNFWGVGLGFFSVDAFGTAAWWEVFVGSLLLLLFFTSVGAATAAVYVRWKALGMYVFWGAFAILLVGGFALATFTDTLPAIGRFFADAGVLGTLAWSLVITALSTVAAYLVLRRATPSNA